MDFSAHCTLSAFIMPARSRHSLSWIYRSVSTNTAYLKPHPLQQISLNAAHSFSDRKIVTRFIDNYFLGCIARKPVN
jgi:hypothetical protein